MILVVNAGSSSIKFKLFNDSDKAKPEATVEGLAERIGIDGALTIEIDGKKHKFDDKMMDHEMSVKAIMARFEELKVISSPEDITAIGFRVVHGGEKITESVIIDEKVKSIIEDNIKLAPLHNPGALTAINAFEANLPGAKLVACFDTSFHQTMPKENFMYSVPYEWYENHDVRKYGMHGISYDYVTFKSQEIFNKNKKDLNLVICHLGNGASMCCVKNGKSFDTTMGLTPLAGLMMGTRSGDIDPSIIQYMAKEKNTDVFAITDELNKKSGLLGVSGLSSDMRDVRNAADSNEKASLAMEMYTKRVANYILQYVNHLEGKVDGLLFTAGVGENSDVVRSRVIEKLPIFKLPLDEAKNSEKYSDFKFISKPEAQFPVLAIRTDEELMICLETLRLI